MNRTIVAVGEVPYDQYFRLPVLIEGTNHQCTTFYGQWCNASFRTTLTSFKSSGARTLSLPLHRLPDEMGHVDVLIFTFPLRSVAKGFCLKQLLRPSLCFWDYFDDFYYGKRTLPKTLLTSTWHQMSDRVLVLSPSLLPRFQNSIHWGNAWHLIKKERTANVRPLIGTIASLDERFDRTLYANLL